LCGHGEAWNAKDDDPEDLDVRRSHQYREFPSHQKRRLRDHIAEFYQVTGLQFEITNKNNSFFVDEMYTADVLLSGLVLSRPGSNHPTLNASDAMLADDLRAGYVDRPDALWELAPDAPKWAMVR